MEVEVLHYFQEGNRRNGVVGGGEGGDQPGGDGVGGPGELGGGARQGSNVTWDGKGMISGAASSGPGWATVVGSLGAAVVGLSSVAGTLYW